METQTPTAIEKVFKPVDYAMLNGKAYSLVDISHEGMDITKEIRDFYKEQYESLVAQQVNVTQANIAHEWNTQVQHLNRINNPQDIFMPSSLIGTPVYYLRGTKEFLPLRTFIYKPSRIQINKYKLRQYLGSDIVDDIELLREFSTDTELIIEFEQGVVNFPMIACLGIKNPNIYVVNGYTYHTFHTDHRICLGNGTAQAYWNLRGEQFDATMSAINTFSLATETVEYGDTRIHLRDLLRNCIFTRAVRLFREGENSQMFDDDDNDRRLGVWNV